MTKKGGKSNGREKYDASVREVERRKSQKYFDETGVIGERGDNEGKEKMVQIK